MRIPDDNTRDGVQNVCKPDLLKMQERRIIKRTSVRKYLKAVVPNNFDMKHIAIILLEWCMKGINGYQMYQDTLVRYDSKTTAKTV